MAGGIPRPRKPVSARRFDLSGKGSDMVPSPLRGLVFCGEPNPGLRCALSWANIVAPYGSKEQLPGSAASPGEARGLLRQPIFIRFHRVTLFVSVGNVRRGRTRVTTLRRMTARVRSKLRE